MRRVHETIELDQSLRRSRSIWLSFAIFAIPFAAAGFVSFLGGIAAILSSGGDTAVDPVSGLWGVFWGSILVSLDFFLFRQAMEASKRLRLLQEDPAANVRPLPAPFQASLFGPYH